MTVTVGFYCKLLVLETFTVENVTVETVILDIFKNLTVNKIVFSYK